MTNIIVDTLKYLGGLRAPAILNVNGAAYATEKIEALPSPAPMASPLVFHSLSGLVDYVASGIDGQPGGRAIVVDDPTSVRYVDKLTKDFRQREVLAKAAPYAPSPFPFGAWLQIEDFVIKALTCFVEDDDRALMLRCVGNLQASEVKTVVDDGVSQEVIAKVGVARVEATVAPSGMWLRPYRTFADVQQPASRFSLRVRRTGSEGLPTVALFEHGDAKWQQDAIDSVGLKLGELLDAAGVKVPVFA